jgi:hypothetical protein
VDAGSLPSVLAPDTVLIEECVLAGSDQHHVTNVHAVPHLAAVMNVQPGRDRAKSVLPSSSVGQVAPSSSVSVPISSSRPPMATEQIFLCVLADDDALHVPALLVSDNCCHSFEGLVVRWTGSTNQSLTGACA